MRRYSEDVGAISGLLTVPLDSNMHVMLGVGTLEVRNVRESQGRKTNQTSKQTTEFLLTCLCANLVTSVYKL